MTQQNNTIEEHRTDHHSRQMIADRTDALEAVLGAVQVPFVIVSPSGLLLFSSSEASELLGVSMNEIGRPFPQAVPEAVVEAAPPAIAVAASTAGETSDVVTLTNGDRYVQEARPLLDLEGNHTGTALTFTSLDAGVDVDHRVEYLFRVCSHILSAQEIVLLRYDSGLDLIYSNGAAETIGNSIRRTLEQHADEVFRSGEDIDLLEDRISWHIIGEPDASGVIQSVVIIGTVVVP